jgi:succinoglycan biosynthesis protein ExoA
VWFEAGLPVSYVPRSTLGDLYRQYRRFGRWKVRYWRRTGDAPRTRQVALLTGVPLTCLTAAIALAMLPPRGRAALVVTGALGATTIEVVGSRRPRGGPVAHGWSAVALGAVGLGWIGGVWAELLAPQKPGA